MDETEVFRNFVSPSRMLLLICFCNRRNKANSMPLLVMLFCEVKSSNGMSTNFEDAVLCTRDIEVSSQP